MKKQLAIAIVAITLTAVLIAPTVMAFAVKDGNSVQYSSHRGYKSITDKSVTASNQPIAMSNGIGARKSSSRVKYHRASVPVRTSNQPIVIDRGIGAVSGISVYSADGKLLFSENFANEIKETDSNIVIIDESGDLNLTIVGEAPPPVKLKTSGLLKDATRLIDESNDFTVEGEAPPPVHIDIQPGMRVVKGKLAYAEGFFVYSADGKLLYFKGTDSEQLLKNGTLVCELAPGITLWRGR